jgi:hypothetical protein
MVNIRLFRKLKQAKGGSAMSHHVIIETSEELKTESDS